LLRPCPPILANEFPPPDPLRCAGAIPRAVSELFEGIASRRGKAEFFLKATFVEIYDEKIRDLLDERGPANGPEIKVVEEVGTGLIKLQGAREVVVHDMQGMLACLEAGTKARTTGETNMNAASSRSHAIFTVTVEQRTLASEDGEAAGDYKISKLHFVDLAGSERIAKSGVVGEAKKEAITINGGLLTLGKVILSLVDSKPHIPYRDSKLTRILQNSLGGNSRTVMVACVSPETSDAAESRSTLEYACNARNIKNTPRVNRDPNEGIISALRRENTNQAKKIESLEAAIEGGAAGISLDSEIIETLRSKADNAVLTVNELREQLCSRETELAEARMKMSQMATTVTAPEPTTLLSPNSIARKDMELQHAKAEMARQADAENAAGQAHSERMADMAQSSVCQKLGQQMLSLSQLWAEVGVSEEDRRKEAESVESHALPVLEGFIASWEERKAILAPECEALEQEAKALITLLEDPEASLRLARCHAGGMLAMHAGLREIITSLEDTVASRKEKLTSLHDNHISLFEQLEREPLPEMPKLEGAGDLSTRCVAVLEKEVSLVEGELQSRKDSYGSLMQEIREAWDTIGYLRDTENELEEAIATHSIETLGFGDTAHEALTDKFESCAALKHAREEEVARLHARLRGSWFAVSKLSAEKEEESTTIAAFEAFLQEHGGLRTTATMACEAELTRLRSVLVEREKPVRLLLETMYNDTYSARSRLHDVFMEIEEEECPVQRMEKLQVELSRLEERKEGMKTLVKLVQERSEKLAKAKEFEDNKNNKNRFAKNASSLKFLEEEKFRKSFVKRYPKLLVLLSREIEAWETANNDTLLIDGERYKELIDSEDTSRLSGDLSNAGKTQAKARGVPALDLSKSMSANSVTASPRTDRTDVVQPSPRKAPTPSGLRMAPSRPQTPAQTPTKFAPSPSPRPQSTPKRLMPSEVVRSVKKANLKKKVEYEVKGKYVEKQAEVENTIKAPEAEEEEEEAEMARFRETFSNMNVETAAADAASLLGLVELPEEKKDMAEAAVEEAKAEAEKKAVAEAKAVEEANALAEEKTVAEAKAAAAQVAEEAKVAVEEAKAVQEEAEAEEAKAVAEAKVAEEEAKAEEPTSSTDDVSPTSADEAATLDWLAEMGDELAEMDGAPPRRRSLSSRNNNELASPRESPKAPAPKKTKNKKAPKENDEESPSSSGTPKSTKSKQGGKAKSKSKISMIPKPGASMIPSPGPTAGRVTRSRAKK